MTVAAATGVDADGSVGAALAKNRTLPADWYTSGHIFGLEQRFIFRRAWDYVGHRGQVAAPGDYFTCESAGVPIVVVHGRDGIVRAFLNICRHRQNAVAKGAGRTRFLVCHYHAWSYKLDGSFNAAPRSSEDPAFDGSALCLTPVGIDFLGQMIFVNASGDAPSLADALGPIPDLARHHEYPLETAVFREMRAVEMEANWKLIWDNNSECYHCPTVHSSWYREAQLGPESSYSFPVGPLQFQHVLNSRSDAPIDNHFASWPAFFLSTDGSSGQGYADRAESLHAPDAAGGVAHHGYFVWRWLPLSPGRTRLEWHMYTTDLVDPVAINAWFEGLLSVISEDKAICESVQRSQQCGVGEPGTLIPGIDSEYQTQVWSRLVHRAVTQPELPLYSPFLERTTTWPPTGRVS